jgi:hypothetical protein
MADFLQPQQNPYADRITEILQKRAQPYNTEQIGLAGESSRLRALAGEDKSVDQILEAIVRKPQQQQVEDSTMLYNMFEQQRANGDKQAEALAKRMEMFTGGDPEGNAIFLQELQNDPENIDPNNAFQVMTKLAGIAKKTGYTSMGTQLKRAQINAANSLATSRASGGSGAHSVFSQTMAAIDADPELSKLPTIDKIRMAQNRLGTNLTISNDGQVNTMEGATDALGSIKVAEKFGGKVGDKVAEQLIAKRQSAQDAQSSLYSNQQARQLLDSGVITGAGADYVRNLGKALQTVGINYGTDEISNTEAFIAQRASAVGNKIKLFGSGTGLSDADRDYAQQMAAGKINLNEQSIRKILELDDQASNRIIQTYNQELSKAPSFAMPYDLGVSPDIGASSSGGWSAEEVQ